MDDADAIIAKYGGKPVAQGGDDVDAIIAKFGGKPVALKQAIGDNDDQVSRQAARDTRLPPGNVVSGTVDAMMNAASSMVAAPLGNVAGLLAAPLHAMSGGVRPDGSSMPEPTAIKEMIQRILTVDPKTQRGVEYSQSNLNPIVAIGNALHWAGEKTGNAIRDPAKSNDTIQNMLANAAQEGVMQAPVLAGASLPKAAGVIGEGLQNMGREKMLKALNPSAKDFQSGKAKQAADFMVEEGHGPGTSGKAKMQDRAEALQSDLTQITQLSDKALDKGQIASALYDTFDRFERMPFARESAGAIQKIMDDFLSHPLLTGTNDLPVALAQDLKQGYYKSIGSANYGARAIGEQQSLPEQAGIAAQKDLARSLKEGIARAEPEVTLLNAEESQLLNALRISNKISQREQSILTNVSKSPWMLHAILSHPKIASVVMLNRSPAFQGMIARMEFNLGKVARAAGGSDTLLPAAADAATSEAERLPAPAQQLYLPAPSQNMSLRDLMPR